MIYNIDGTTQKFDYSDNWALSKLRWNLFIRDTQSGRNSTKKLEESYWKNAWMCFKLLEFHFIRSLKKNNTLIRYCVQVLSPYQQLGTNF